MHESGVIPMVLFILGLTGFLIAFIILFRRKHRRRETAFYKLVTTLLWVDATGFLGSYPLVIAAYANDRQWIGGKPACDYFGFVTVFACQGSSLLIAIMAIERFISIKQPMLHAYYINSPRSTVVILVSLLLPAIYACLPFVDVGQYSVHHTGTWCTFFTNNNRPRDVRFALTFAITGILCIVVTNLCNSGALFVILWPRVCIRNNEKKPNRNQKTKVSKAEKNMIALLTGISVTLTAGWTPSLARIFINQFGPSHSMNPSADLIAGRLASFNQVLDPWIYIILRRDLVVHIVEWFRRHRTKHGTDDNTKKLGNSVIVLYSSRRSKTSSGSSEGGKVCGVLCINEKLIPTSHM